MADWTVNKTEDEGMALPWSGERIAILKKTVDFTVDPLTTTSYLALFKIPAGSIVLAAGMKVVTADAQISDVDLGLCTYASSTVTIVDIDAFGDALDPSSTGWKVDPNAAYNCAGADGFKVVSADSYMTLYINTGATMNDAVIDFYAVVVNIN